MDHDGHRKRLRERFMRAGVEAFAAHEILELLLTYAIPRRDTKPIAYALMNRFGSLHAVLQATPNELMLVDGIGESAAVLLAMMLPVFREYRRSLVDCKEALTNYQQAVRYCEALFEGERYEKFYVICLDAQMRRLNTVLISAGDVTEVQVYARHVISALTQCSAVGAIVTHNHPTGSAMPSHEDVKLTSSICYMLECVKMKLYDHMIVSPSETFSFCRGGLMEASKSAMTEAAQNYERILPAVRKDIYRLGRLERGDIAKCDIAEYGDFQ